MALIDEWAVSAAVHSAPGYNCSKFNSSSGHIDTNPPQPEDPKGQQQQQQQQQQRNTKRRVMFADTLVVIPAPSPLDQLPEAWERESLWYGVRELYRFRAEARDLCRRIRSTPLAAYRLHHKICTNSSHVVATELLQHPTAPDCFDWTNNNTTSTRGLEQRACFERQRRKYLSVKYVVAKQRGLTAPQLAKMTTQCSRWAVQLAYDEATRDFERAYDSDTQQKQQAQARDQTLDDPCFAAGNFVPPPPAAVVAVPAPSSRPSAKDMPSSFAAAAIPPSSKRARYYETLLSPSSARLTEWHHHQQPPFKRQRAPMTREFTPPFLP